MIQIRWFLGSVAVFGWVISALAETPVEKAPAAPAFSLAPVQLRASNEPEASKTLALSDGLAPEIEERKQECGCLKQFMEDHKLKPFGELYAAGVHLDRVDTTAFFGFVRYGLRTEDFKWEAYAVARGAGDTRTGANDLGQIYNDNYLFTGAGLDYLIPVGPDTKWIQGAARLTGQVGMSFDLDDKIDRGGFDYRVGMVTYHEIPFPKLNVVEEIYSDALYFQRYRNFIASIQARTFWPVVDEKLTEKFQLKFGPIGTIAAGADSDREDFNNYYEFRAGVRLSVKGPVSISLQPEFVRGYRWERPTTLPNYKDFRVLVTVYCGF